MYLDGVSVRRVEDIIEALFDISVDMIYNIKKDNNYFAHSV